MYVEKQKAHALTYDGVKEFLLKRIEDILKNKYGSVKDRKAIKEGMGYNGGAHLDSVVRQLIELNDAMLNGRSVGAICEKEPRGNLDTGRHYYSVRYVDTKGQLQKMWGYEFYYLIGQESQDRDRQMYKYIYSSGAIGMSRLLDATDSLFNLLRDVGGCYAQIEFI